MKNTMTNIAHHDFKRAEQHDALRSHHGGYFEEKAADLNVERLVAFGITLESRYGKARELRELLHFAELVADARLHPFVISAHYDSKSFICQFDLHPGVVPGSSVERELREAAGLAVSQFIWLDDCVHHGNHGEGITRLVADAASSPVAASTPAG